MLSLADVINPPASQAEAESGTDAVKRMTPLSTAQAIDSRALTPASIGTTIGTVAAGNDSRIVNAIQAGESALEQPTLVGMASYTPNVFPDFLRTAGYYSPGDGGGALYKKVALEPSHSGKFSIISSMGVTSWYEIADGELKLRSFGAKGDGTICTTEVLAAFTAGVALGRTVIDGGGIYPIGNINTTTLAGLRFRGAGTLTQFRPLANSQTLFSFVLGASGLCAQDWQNFSIFCGSFTAIKGFQFTLANVLRLSGITFYGCETNYEIDRGGHFHLADSGANISEGTVSNKAGRFKIWSSVDSAYAGGFSSFGIHEIVNNGNGVQDNAYFFRRAVAIRFQPNSIIANNDGTGNNTGNRTGTCVLVENDCQGLNICGVICGYDIGLKLQLGTGVAGDEPKVNDFSQLDIDQCFTRAIDIVQGVDCTFSDVHVTSSFVSTANVGQVKVRSTAGKGIRFNNLRVSGYYTNPGTAIDVTNTDGVTFSGGLVSGCFQGFDITGATNLQIKNMRATDTPTGRVGNPGGGTVITDCVGINAYDPYIPSTPTVVSGSGTITAASAQVRWLKKDTRNYFQLKVVITTNGTGAGNIQVTMPFTSFFDAAGGGREVTAAGIGLAWSMGAGSNILFISKVDATYPGGNGFTLLVSGCVESTS